MEVDGLERHGAEEEAAHENHARDQEKKNIVAGFNNRSRMVVGEVVFVSGLSRRSRFGEGGPAEGGKCPERGREPCVQHIWVLRYFSVAMGTFFYWLNADNRGTAFA